MKRVVVLTVLVLGCILVNAQVPLGFNYQAIARDDSGNPISGSNIRVMISILSDTLAQTIEWEELHDPVKTNSFGLFTLVIGKGVWQTGSAQAFSDIDWTIKPLFLKTQIYYQNSWKYMGSVELWSVPYSLVARELEGAVSKLEVIGEDPLSDEALFEVKRKDGQTMFAVYNFGVRVYMPLDTLSKARRGGFAIGGFDKAKGVIQDYFVVNPDSIRAYIDTNPAKAKRGGFAIGGFDRSKIGNEEYLRVTRDSTRIYFSDADPKGNRGGFAIGGFDRAKRLDNDYMFINPDSTNIYVRKISADQSSTFNIIGIDQNLVRTSLLTANPDTVSISGVLKVQSNLIVITSEISSITLTSATSGGNVTTDGGDAVTARGVCWSTSSNPTTSDSKTSDGVGLGSFTSSITGLTPGTNYHVRAYATNSGGTAYGADLPFTTNSSPVVPTVTTKSIYPIGPTTAISGGSITSDGGAVVTIRGVCWSTSSNPTTSDSKTSDGSGSGSFASNIIGLSPGTTYHVRAYATNSAGTGYGADMLFTTKICIEVITAAITSVTSSTATSGGNISSSCGDLVTARGLCWSQTPDPTLADSYTTEGSGAGPFTSNLTGLSSGTIYYVRAYATTGLGTSYGNQVSFTTLSTILDYDGNVYKVVLIGTQYWMQENLKTERLNDGSPMNYSTDASAWNIYTTPAYCYYDTNTANKSVYGALYNWYAVNSGKLCPTGWHVPTDSEWTTLITYLGDYGVSGGKLKETGTSHWISPNIGATNESGFTALPGGWNRSYSMWYFSDAGYVGYWWSSTPVPETPSIYCMILGNGSTGVTRGESFYKNDALSVRCVKD